jgi:hypothetical protein
MLPAVHKDGSPLRTGRSAGKGRPGSGPHRERERGIARRPNTTGLQDRPGGLTAAATVPCAAATGSPLSDSLLGSDTRRCERHGPSGALSLAGRDRPRAARHRPSSASHPLSRAAVIGVTSHADATATPRGLTADPAHNVPPSAGQAQACLADIPAKRLPFAASARTIGVATGITAHLSSLTPPSPALAPGASPQPSRLTPSTLGACPLTGLPSDREAASLPGATARGSDAARIAHPCSAPATPEAREGGTRSGVRATANFTGTTEHPSSLHAVPNLPLAASASPLPTYLQIGGQRGRRFVAPAGTEMTSRASVGLDQKSNQHANRPAGKHPAGVTRALFSKQGAPLASAGSSDAGGLERVGDVLGGVWDRAERDRAPKPVPGGTGKAHGRDSAPVAARHPSCVSNPLQAPTQGGPRSSATRTDRGQSSAPTRRRQGVRSGSRRGHLNKGR